jgi:hypothetical protein
VGKKNTEFADKTKGLAYNVIVKLCESLVDQGYRLYTDCFYTSLPLAEYLLCRKIYLIGVLKCNSLSIPEVLKDVKLWGKVAKRGDFRWFRRENFVYVQWKDCKVVTFMSPLHQGSAVTQCKRTIKSRTSWKKRELVQPSVANAWELLICQTSL